jgi:hypothetical protein
MHCTCNHEYGEVCSVCELEDPVIKAYVESGEHDRMAALFEEWGRELGIGVA